MVYTTNKAVNIDGKTYNPGDLINLKLDAEVVEELGLQEVDQAAGESAHDDSTPETNTGDDNTGDDDADTAEYTVVSKVQVDGTEYDEGEIVELTEAEAEELGDAVELSA